MTISLDITGMTCDHCAHTIQQALLAVSGVSRAEVSYPAGTAQVKPQARCRPWHCLRLCAPQGTALSGQI